MNWQNGITPINEDNMNNLVQEPMISDKYDSTHNYVVGDYCIYNNTLYRCTTAISTAEEFNSAHWVAVKVSDELKNKLNNTIIVTETGQDLNDYKTRGLYWFGSTNPVNRPANIAGWLEVIEYNNRYVRQIWHRSSSINGTAEFETYIRFTNDYGTNWSSWDKIVMRNELDELNISSDAVSGGSTWSKTLTNGTYLIVLTRTNGGTSAGLYVANINSTSFLTTVNAYYAAGAELTLSEKVVSITPNAAMTATVIKLTGR